MQKINLLLLNSDMLNSSLVRSILLSSCVAKIYIQRQTPIDSYTHPQIEFVNLIQYKDLYSFVKEKNISLAISFFLPFYEQGMVNYLKYNVGVPTVGITRYWMQLENDKLFGKKFMKQNEILTPEYKVVKNMSEVSSAIKEFGFPLVVKNNTQQVGFGVKICRNKYSCYLQAITLLKKYGFFLIEKYKKGEEATIHFLWDGKIVKALEPVRDFKKSGNNNTGINTGSMGSYVPINFSDKQKKLISKYVEQINKVFQNIKPNFTGIFVSNILLTSDELYTLEFNMRNGTPEFETLLEHTTDDIVYNLYNLAIGNLENIEFHYKTGITASINIVHKKYIKHSYKPKIEKIILPKNFLLGKNDIKINSFYLVPNDKEEIYINPFYKICTLIKNDENNPYPYLYEYLKKIKDKNLYYRKDMGISL